MSFLTIRQTSVQEVSAVQVLDLIADFAKKNKSRNKDNFIPVLRDATLNGKLKINADRLNKLTPMEKLNAFQLFVKWYAGDSMASQIEVLKAIGLPENYAAIIVKEEVKKKEKKVKKEEAKK